ncbi:MAG: glycosyltransferase family 2 protein [Bacteroidetes bacterium]|nr:glycosyltransferase family 2 protein [Bacteroidota bacterium]
MIITRLSIIIPVYNEQETVVPILEKVLAVKLPDGIVMELVVVDDASTDSSATRVEEFLKRVTPDVSVSFIRHKQNKGKGGAIHSAIKHINGEYMIIQDADLELDPNDFMQLLEPVLKGSAEVVYGSRFLNNSSAGQIRNLSFMANAFLTALSNISFGTRLTDMETCYKLMPVHAVKKLNLKEERFGFEPEVTAKIARDKTIRFAEVPVTYIARTDLQGKKIGWKDGVRALWCIIRYGILRQ